MDASRFRDLADRLKAYGLPIVAKGPHLRLTSLVLGASPGGAA
ncbi:hypothetical protein BJY27_006798 [Streptomyces rapamycinicus]|uniref:Uncharacterized protein n=2 Tax=Streptomyces rapamycinicus TaxID=1226757 RepID=A0A3L8RGY6_STRRN|nr:hypothetical protein [Streptomyces rapamycinicus]RLV78699.1 hypothetical protein D3C57_109980 [Streptomyces rapamycinicus NRRL 5491]